MQEWQDTSLTCTNESEKFVHDYTSKTTTMKVSNLHL